MTKSFFRGMVLAAFFVLSACDDPATNQTYVHPAGTWDFLIEATKAGPLLLKVQGEAFDMDRAAFEAEVSDMIAGALQKRRFSVTTDPSKAPQPSLYVVMTFNGAKSLNGQAQCKGETQGGTPRGSDARLDVTASFCGKDARYATVTGWIEKLKSRDDEKYSKLIGQISRDLFVEQKQDK
ncbi:hypothetical protein [Pelagibius sp. Alg239-R121]|uniref:hypothetical protein n=1 Tax=Pelagibius sp. Alg239-R121 TaxID=2993448 RepID=UPI0024A65C12|nr:hypothetical protein [Pelagibius sp. Alg239-R121]